MKCDLHGYGQQPHIFAPLGHGAGAKDSQCLTRVRIARLKLTAIDMRIPPS